MTKDGSGETDVTSEIGSKKRRTVGEEVDRTEGATPQTFERGVREEEVRCVTAA